MEKKIEVYYDGLCRMCSGAMDVVDRSHIGSRFERKDVTKGELPINKTIAEALHDMHVIDDRGNVYAGIDGILRIAEEYPRWRWTSRMGNLPIVHGCLWLLYRIVAAHRRRFN